MSTDRPAGAGTGPAGPGLGPGSSTEAAGTSPERAGPGPLVRIDGGSPLRTLTLDSPHNRNALSTPLMRRLLAGLAEAVADDTVRAVLLSHTGRVFCSGVDLTEPGGAPAALLDEVLTAVWECPKPVVARIGGPARAGGLGLVAAADIAVCAADATFAFTEVRLGVIPAVISATVLRRLTPRAAAELYLTGEVFDGRRAAAVGLVTTAVPAEELDAAVTGYARALAQGAPQALIGTKELVRRVPAATVRDDLAELSPLSVRYFESAEGREGVRAFREKRPPNWVLGT